MVIVAAGSGQPSADSAAPRAPLRSGRRRSPSPAAAVVSPVSCHGRVIGQFPALRSPQRGRFLGHEWTDTSDTRRTVRDPEKTDPELHLRQSEDISANPRLNQLLSWLIFRSPAHMDLACAADMFNGLQHFLGRILIFVVLWYIFSHCLISNRHSCDA